MAGRSIILLEANEIPFKIFDYFRGRRPDSTIAAILERGHQFRTFSEDRCRFIMPWTTWPSLHRGVNDEVHQIFKFGQWELATNERYPPIWSLLAAGGIRAGVFSSMQSAPLPPNARDYAFYFPDMFSTATDAHPAELGTLQEFNLAMTRASARNVSRGIDLKHGARVLAGSAALGIRTETYIEIAMQLAREMVNPARKTRRRAYQPVLLFDAFYRQLQRTRPRFATFFTNHVAAAMHRYWAAVFPEDYEQFALDRGWVDRYCGEIEFAMSKLDKLVRKLVAFVDENPDYILAIATSMGQAAIPASHVREFLTITDVPKFMSALNLERGEYEERPAMVPDFSFSVASGKADMLEHRLRSLQISGKTIDIHRDRSFFHVSVYDERSGLRTAQLNGEQVNLAGIGIGYLVHEDEVACTAQHIPEGSLIIYSPHSSARPDGRRTDISVLDFAPSVLKHFDLPVPGYMKQSPAILGPLAS